MNIIPFQSFAYSKKGRGLKNGKFVSKDNEDYKKSDVYKGIFITADGIGGHSEAKTASRHATLLLYADIADMYKILQRQKTDDDEYICEVLNTLVKRCNEHIHAWGQLPSAYKCGTTIDAVLIHDNKAFGAHVGDGTVYKLNTQDNTLKILTLTDKDRYIDLLSSLENDMVNAGNISNYIGMDKISIYSFVEPISKSDIIIMATDGFSKKVHPNEIIDSFKNQTFEDGFINLKRYCHSPKMMKEIVQGLRQKDYEIGKNIFKDDTTFISIKRRI